MAVLVGGGSIISLTRDPFSRFITLAFAVVTSPRLKFDLMTTNLGNDRERLGIMMYTSIPSAVEKHFNHSPYIYY